MRATFELPVGLHFGSRTGPTHGQFTLQPKQSKQIDMWFNPKHMFRENQNIHFEFGNKYFMMNAMVRTNFDQTQLLLKTVKSKVQTGMNAALVQTTAEKIMQTQKMNTISPDTLKLTTRNAKNVTYDQQKYDKVIVDQTQNYQAQFVNKTQQLNEQDSDSSQVDDAANYRMLLSKSKNLNDQKVTAYNDALDLGMNDTAYAKNDLRQSKTAKAKNFVEDEITEVQKCVEIAAQRKDRPALKNDHTPTVKQYLKEQFEPIVFAKIESEVKAKLTQRQLMQITMGPSNYKFGELTAMTSITKYFKIANDLQQYIKVELKPQNENIQLMSQDSSSSKIYSSERVNYLIQDAQYLPPGHYTSFLIQC